MKFSVRIDFSHSQRPIYITTKWGHPRLFTHFFLVRHRHNTEPLSVLCEILRSSLTAELQKFVLQTWEEIFSFQFGKSPRVGRNEVVGEGASSPGTSNFGAARSYRQRKTPQSAGPAVAQKVEESN